MRTLSLAANLVSTFTAITLLGGCLDHPLKDVEYDKIDVPEVAIDLDINRDVDILFVIDNSGSMADEQARLARNFTSFVGALDKIDVPEVDINLDINRDVDILFVIDNSGSMADEQARLARNFTSFVSALDTMDVEYRIGLTTTDVSRTACEGTSPEDGDLVLRSCLDAVADGAFANDTTDAAAACTAQCNLGQGQLAIQPSLAADGQRLARPWLESIGGQQNLPAGTTMAQALACFGPQGIDGCGYESPLEAMRLALTKARSDKSQFLRDQALLAVVFVTDEADCSTNPAFEQAFTSEPTFWNAEQPYRTSGICWRAGVECTGEGPEYEECHAINRSLAGEPAVSDDDAVLYSTDRYIGFLDGLREKPRDEANALTGAGPRVSDVLVSLIAGVPVGYDKGTAEIPYADAPAGSEQDISFGVAPGCINTEDGSNSTAIPPVREREVAEAFAQGDERNLFSICQDDYTDALAQIARAIERELPEPACSTACIADQDPSSATLEPTCEVHETFRGDTRELSPCTHDGSGWQTPDGDDVCFFLLTDPDHRTESTLDDMTVKKGQTTAACNTDDSNIEFGLHRSGPRKPDATYKATCLAAANDNDCKND